MRESNRQEERSYLKEDHLNLLEREIKIIFGKET
jgi:hypothetical protein